MIYFILEILGTIAFAISGAMTGIRAKMDILGVSVLGITTAVGGGIIRDILIDVVPPVALQKPEYALIAAAVALIVFIPAVRIRINTDAFLINLIDAVGLGVFTVVGVKAGAGYDNPFLQIFIGTLTGVGGGVLRDLFAMEKPMIFVRHFYAAASIIGAVLCVIIMRYDEGTAMVAGAAAIVLLRIMAAKLKWHLPKA